MVEPSIKILLLLLHQGLLFNSIKAWQTPFPTAGQCFVQAEAGSREMRGSERSLSELKNICDPARSTIHRQSVLNNNLDRFNEWNPFHVLSVPCHSF